MEELNSELRLLCVFAEAEAVKADQEVVETRLPPIRGLLLSHET